jgi:hypothetical protein
MGDCLKFDCYYEMINGKSRFIGSSDTIMLSKEKGLETKQQGWFFASKHEHEFMKNTNPFVEEMLDSMGFELGYCTISFFYKDGLFYAFEAGFRLSGEHSYDYQQVHDNDSHLVDLICYHVGLPIPERQQRNNNIMMLSYNLYVRDESGDVVESVDTKELENMPNIKAVVHTVNKGSELEKDTPVKICMVNVVGENEASILESILAINEKVKVIGKKGEKKFFQPITTIEGFNRC